MSDEQLQSLLETWFADTDPAPPDTRQTAVEVMARVPETRQRGRWWPLPPLRQKAQTATAIETIEEQPGPTAAIYGHIPTVIGRTRLMFNPVRATIVGALVFALGGVFLVAQPFEQQDAGGPAARVTQLPAVTVTSSQDCDLPANQGGACTHTASDARVTGPLTFSYTGDIGGPATAEVELVWADATLEGPDGDWTGHLYLVWTEPTQAFAVLSGDGAYEGWQYVASGIDPEADGDHDWSGVIYEGALPPYGPLLGSDE